MMNKIDKDFVLSDSSVNCYGFRFLTSGYNLSEYQRNPIGYYMHQRDAGVLVKWDDLRIDGDKVLGKPCINLSHPRGKQTIDEIEKGFLNAASLGHFVLIEMSEEPGQMISGQTGPTVTKWYNRECSLVDIPGNMNALVLFDKNGNKLSLTALQARFSKPFISTVEEVSSDEVLELISLGANELYRKEKLDRLKEISFAHYLLMYKEVFKVDYPGAIPIGLNAKVEQAKKEIDAIELSKLMALTGQQLYMEDGAMERLKELNFSYFKLRYKEVFNIEYKVN